eukprot:c9295_g2_i1.p1 GENE.c9295_g2_i1~~c9295_g2_i1.p1  ORF type:complete len:362 (-),score=121.92 c9295_g2_i1:155-1240(-)
MVELEDKIGHDNRAGIDGCLHRISVMRDRSRAPLGFTMRVGRAIIGSSNLISDLINHPDKPSILLLGPPGTGKTSIVRDIARVMSEAGDSVVVVDTSNEICGCGTVPHEAVGLARRMMVRSRAEQADILIEAVQNHTPDVIVVDEIGHKAEVASVKTIEARGVRLVGSAHGNLISLLHNQDLNALIGGKVSSTIGDQAAKARSRDGELHKVLTKRANKPVFDVVIELGQHKTNQNQTTATTATTGLLRPHHAQPAHPSHAHHSSHSHLAHHPSHTHHTHHTPHAHHTANNSSFDDNDGELEVWRVIKDTASAVDSMLAHGAYNAQNRMRHKTSGEMYLELTRVKVSDKDMKQMMLDTQQCD